MEIATADKLEYQFQPINSGTLNFKVRASNDAHIALTSGPMESNPMYEIFIGGWNNSKSVIRYCKQKPDVVEADTPDVLNGGEFRGFWIRWSGGHLSVGREGEAAPFMAWEDPQPFGIGYYGVCTGWGASGSWIVEAGPAGGWSMPQGGGGGGAACWVDARDGEIPPGAVIGGSDNGDLFVARAMHEGALIPGKFVPAHGVCYVAWGGAEHGHNEYQVLCGCSPNWVPTTGGAVPGGALPAGESEDGEPLFVGRVQHEGTVSIGKVQASHGVCYISYAGQELGFDQYEVLVA